MLNTISTKVLERQRSLLQKAYARQGESFGPPQGVFSQDLQEYEPAGKALLAQGAAGFLLLAGGQGTRLGSHAPKGMFPISVVNGKSLFEIFCRKVAAASKAAQALFPLAIMLSSENAQEVRKFFAENDYFGLPPSAVFFFEQGALPFLDNEGGLILNEDGTVVMAPDGNGRALDAFYASGIWETWRQKGIERVLLAPVDNPLTDPFCPRLLGYSAAKKVDLIVKAIERDDPEEKVGVVVGREDGRLAVIEYSELSEKVRYARTESGKLFYPYANISCFVVSMPLIEKVALAEEDRPLHKVYKPVQGYREDARQGRVQVQQGWKFETFIFDILDLTENAKVVAFPREEVFAPLKNKEGKDSPSTVKAALQEVDSSAFIKFFKSPPPPFPFELDAEFHYPTEELALYWEGRKPPSSSGYIGPK